MKSLEQFPESSKEVKKEILEKFIDYRDNYLDDLPSERLRPGDENYHFYKCRGNFFQGVIADIAVLFDEKVINDSEIEDKFKEFLEYCSKKDFSEFSTKEDIDKVNEMIECIIVSLRE